jgi:diguanylate cyclase (GGDEF)-like protein
LSERDRHDHYRGPGPFRALTRGIEGLPRAVVFSLALATVAVVGAVDERAGGDVQLTLAYLLAVSFAAWFLGVAGGLGVALAGAVSSWAAEVATRAYVPRAGVQALNFALELTLLATAAALVSVLRQRLARDRAVARTDVLTGLLNRRGFLEVARRELARTTRTGRPLTVAIADVDGFKEINDVRGHEAGDQLLGGLAAALRTATRAVDACARLGGDEFAVLLPDTDPVSVEAVLDRLRQVLVQAGAEKGAPMTVSLGAVTFERPPLSLDEMLRAADRMLREVKTNGRNGVRHEIVSEQFGRSAEL